MKRKIINGIIFVIVVIGIAWAIGALIPFSVAIPIFLAWMAWKKKTQIFHDKIEPKSAERILKVLKASLLVALISFAMILTTILLGVLIFHPSEDVLFYIGFFWFIMFDIATSNSLVIYFKARRKPIKRNDEITEGLK
ncbi:MAG: hypothetical protein AMJ70_05430 [Dehalococcoidia bacterium SG8_51_3]|nr:MAG: hypothetical protein AMJ70_05430 [Dehalococcoidia bacterium SG8_51_3]